MKGQFFAVSNLLFFRIRNHPLHAQIRMSFLGRHFQGEPLVLIILDPSDQLNILLKIHSISSLTAGYTAGF